MNDSSNQGSSLPSPSSLLSGVTPVTTLGNSTNANYVPASTQAVVCSLSGFSATQAVYAGF